MAPRLTPVLQVDASIGREALPPHCTKVQVPIRAAVTSLASESATWAAATSYPGEGNYMKRKHLSLAIGCVLLAPSAWAQESTPSETPASNATRGV